MPSNYYWYYQNTDPNKIQWRKNEFLMNKQGFGLKFKGKFPEIGKVNLLILSDIPATDTFVGLAPLNNYINLTNS